MSARTTAIWTCDRCGVQAEVDPTKQPTGWTGVIIVDPPASAADGTELADRKHLCRRCTGRVREFLVVGDPEVSP